MKALLAAGLLLCATAAPVLGSQADCQADLDLLRAALGEDVALDGPDPLAALAPVSEDGRCVLRDLAVQMPDGAAPGMLEAQEISWRATWPDAAPGGVPQSLVLDIRGARMVPQLRDMADMAYQMRLTAELSSTDLHLDYAIDPAAKRLVLSSLDVAQTGGNRLALSGTVENFDLTALTAQPPQLDKVMQFRLTDLDLRLRNAGLFESMAMLWLSAIQPQFGDTPEAAVDNARAWLTEQIGAMPDYLVTQDSRVAMAAMVATLPHPEGVMHLKLSTENGIAGQDVMPAFLLGRPTWAMLEQPLAGVRLSADWQPPEACDCDADW